MFLADVVRITAPALPGLVVVPHQLGRTPNAVRCLCSIATADGQPPVANAVMGAGVSVDGGGQWAISNAMLDNQAVTAGWNAAVTTACLILRDGTGALLLEATVGAFGPKLTLNFTSTTPGLLVTVIAIAADDVAAGTVAVLGPLGTVTPVGGLGFSPRWATFDRTVGLFPSSAAGNAIWSAGYAAQPIAGGILQGGISFRSAAGQAASAVGAITSADRVIPPIALLAAAGVELTAWNADGFDLTNRDAVNNDRTVGWFAVGCAEDASVSVAQVAAGDGNRSFGGLAFAPSFLLRRLSYNTALAVEATVNVGAVSVGAAVAARSGCAAVSDEDAASPSVTRTLTNATLANLILDTDGSDLRVGSLVTFDPAGWTENYTGGDASARFGVVLAVEQSAQPQRFLQRRHVAYRSRYARRLRRWVA